MCNVCRSYKKTRNFIIRETKDCYSHIFPDFRAQHCNYATLLAGRKIVTSSGGQIYIGGENTAQKLNSMRITYYYYYYYYSHIFPDSRAQHCNYATLLAGRKIVTSSGGQIYIGGENTAQKLNSMRITSNQTGAEFVDSVEVNPTFSKILTGKSHRTTSCS